MRLWNDKLARASLFAVAGSAVAIGFAACSSSSTPSAQAGSDGGPPPSDGSAPPADGRASEDAAAEDAGALDAGADVDAAPVDAALPPFAVIGSIPVGGMPTALAFNPASNVLYVALAQGGVGSGIAVVDAAQNVVASTIAIPGDASAPPPIAMMAVDYGASVLYAIDANPAGQTLYAIDIAGVSNSVVAALPIGSAQAIQVDSTAHVAYVLGGGAPATPDGGANAVTPVVVTAISGGGTDAGASTELDDLALTPATSIAFDALTERLYVCGPNAVEASNKTLDLAALDVLSAQTLSPLDAQQSFAKATAIACLSGWGGAAVVTRAAAAVDFVGVDSGTVSLPATLVPVLATGAGGTVSQSVAIFGEDSTSKALEVAAVSWLRDGGAQITLPVTPTPFDAGAASWSSVTQASASGGVFRVYLTYAAPDDAGAFVVTPNVVYASVEVEP